MTHARIDCCDCSQTLQIERVRRRAAVKYQRRRIAVLDFIGFGTSNRRRSYSPCSSVVGGQVVQSQRIIRRVDEYVAVDAVE